ncbi:MAG TPA: class II fumarate hydratase [Mycobacteriales bacterium]|jgi:fumarate hydratase class II|nr:class II fumarate hydratase [Mycobacteriales bacterium]
MLETDGSGPLWGPATERAVTAFPVSGQRLPRPFLRILALIKQQAAATNAELGLLEEPVAAAIGRAAQEVIDGAHWDQFPVDVYQTGSGTSTNMNCNEVLAALATGFAGTPVHPNDDVNRCQSSNDVIPTTMQLSAAVAAQDSLLPALRRLADALAEKQQEFWPVLKLARTHLQDATPIRLGQEFRGYAGQVHESIRRIRHAVEELEAVPLGGTAAGTGINCHPEFAARTCARLAERTGLRVRETDNHFYAQATLDAVITAHGLIRAAALAIWKISSDLRLLATGSRSGFGEIVIPDIGVTSSIMPGKVPPAVVESATMVVARIVGNDATIGFAQTGSFLELNVMMPVVATSLLESIELLAATADNLAVRCVAGLEATEHGPRNVERGTMLVTALSPLIGYDAATGIVRQAREQDRTVREVALEHGFAAEQLDALLEPGKLTAAHEQVGNGSAPAG